MKKFNNFLDNKLIPFMTKISNQVHAKAIRKGFIAVLPVTFIGSLIILLHRLPLSIIEKNQKLLFELYEITLGLIGIFLVIAVSYNLAKEYEMERLSIAQMSLVNYLLVSISFTEQKITLDYLITPNLFTAIIVAVLTVEIIRITDQFNFECQLPEQIPTAVCETFTSLIPGFESVLFFTLFSYIFQSVWGTPLSGFINYILSPVVNIVDSAFGVFFFGVLSQLLWFAGTHGVATVGVILRPFLEQNWLVNAHLQMSGQEMEHIFTMPFWNFYMLIGGSGATLVLSLLCRKSKVEQLRETGKVSLLSSLFNIDEPILFASPLVANKIMFIPFIFIQPTIGVIAYFAIKYGLVSKSFIRVPWVTPAPIGAFISTLDWRSLVLVIVLALLSGLLYYPFFKRYEQKLLQENE
ncbi:PTS sugar transporter subunit IIC [Halanaerobacter jeridensis]|uniref:Permease IIC component n=1 Tax=Halanaerobacter jeridensis TaxID=706427 RepID=A0A938XRW2_9FIRM|nr:PTS transporter subunit EIIC [Halanaerobacter jeridensis]MBM7555679.1 PTS system cellobiose-specific IIC component [Halanaerobacter jeridensis]